MKKNKKIFWISLSILLILLICGSGIYMGYKECQKVKKEVIMESQEEQQKEKMEMIRIAKDHKKEMDEQVRYGDKDNHIKTITYEWDTVNHNPMGGFELQGYVNNDKNLDFGISFDSDNGGKSIYCYEYRESKKLGELIGDY